MTKPVRIQLSRRKGYDLHKFSEATNGLQVIVVSRPSEFGNPFAVEIAPIKGGKSEWSVHSNRNEQSWRFATREEAIATSVDLFRTWLKSDVRGKHLAELAVVALRGKNLACWCAIGTPCHADVLMEIANFSAAEVAISPSDGKRTGAQTGKLLAPG